MSNEEKFKEVGAILKSLRDNNKYTQEQLADYLDLSQSQIAKIENGSRNINLTTLDKLCLLYNCSHDYILGETTEYSLPKIAFRANNKNNLEIISKMNQIMNNLDFLIKLDNEE